jgi:hypothetical protein
MTPLVTSVVVEQPPGADVRAAFLQDGVHGPFQRRRRSLPLPCCYSLIRTVA